MIGSPNDRVTIEMFQFALSDYSRRNASNLGFGPAKAPIPAGANRVPPRYNCGPVPARIN